MIAAAGLVAGGCATTVTVPGDTQTEIAGVPFFPQERYQCGPAALATVLDYRGVNVAPDELVPMVYVPSRKGSFQIELVAAARQLGTVAVTIPPMPEALFSEVAAGNPVLVLQNLQFDWLPKWHYAVVVGYDPASDIIILRSGMTEQLSESASRFFRSWGSAGNWGLVVLAPGDVPATVAPKDYVTAVIASSDWLEPAAIAAAYEAGAARWPKNLTMTFAAANHARARGDDDRAATLYRRALDIDPRNPYVLNNFADLLLSEGCAEPAARMITLARQNVDPESAIAPILVDTQAEIEATMLQDSGPDSLRDCAAYKDNAAETSLR